jgi:hypothetical protein
MDIGRFYDFSVDDRRIMWRLLLPKKRRVHRKKRGRS